MDTTTLQELPEDCPVRMMIAEAVKFHDYDPDETVRITTELIEAATLMHPQYDHYDLAPLISDVDGIRHVETPTMETITAFCS